MHIVCCLKQVPDTADVRIDPETNTLIREGVESILNPYDAVAVEQALRIRERFAGTVTCVSMGPPQSENVLREALSLGADRVFLLSDRAFAGADTLATSYTLACAIRRLDREDPVQIVICGKQAIDGDTAQTGPGVATRLGYTLFTYVEEIRELDPGQGAIEVVRRLDRGREVLVGRLPVLLTVELELAKPRRASLPDTLWALRAEIPVWNGEAIEADPTSLGIKGSPTWVRRIESPPARESGPKFDAAQGTREAVGRALDLVLDDSGLARNILSSPGE